MLSKKIDFAVIIEVNHANPNGDPLNGNRPRSDYEGYGEITDVCIKRKIRNRLLESGESIFVQSDDTKVDDATSLRNRAEKIFDKDMFNEKKTKKELAIGKVCEKWFDVRAFGQLFAWSGDSVSIAIRGPVSIQSAFSVEPVSITSTQITKSVNSEKDDGGKASDTMGMKHRVDHGVYVFCGSMNPQLAQKTGFSDADADRIKVILPKLFENDASSARPEGSMIVKKVFWWEHNCKAGQYSSAKVHHTLAVNLDGTYQLNNLENLTPQEIDGF